MGDSYSQKVGKVFRVVNLYILYFVCMQLTMVFIWYDATCILCYCSFYKYLNVLITVEPQLMVTSLNIEASYKRGNGSPENGVTGSSLNEGKMMANKCSFCLPIMPTTMLVLCY